MVKRGEIVRFRPGEFLPQEKNHPCTQFDQRSRSGSRKADAFARRLMSHPADVAASQGLPVSQMNNLSHQVDGLVKQVSLGAREIRYVVLKGTSARKMFLGDDQVGLAIRRSDRAKSRQSRTTTHCKKSGFR